MKLPLLKKKIWIAAVTAGVVVLTLVPSLYFYNQYRGAQERLQNPEKNAKQEIENLIERISRLIVLPTGEEPTVATVSDIEQLKNQPFFTSAQNGDKVLIYNAAKKAILYRPAVNKIVEVAPITVVPNTEAASTSAQPAPQPVSVVLYNGTATGGLTKQYETELKATLPNVTIVSRDNAKKTDYAESLVVDLTGTREAQGKDMAKQLGMSYSPLPAGETKPTGADFLIILGEDKK